ncbi:MAG: metallopeptidase family protein [Candidatus Kerfeldbacteria bacterium]|nr:metallopeptidase family protein [Candidatus Kerfeldbacteria bacterium]
MERSVFEELVQQGLARIPERFRRLLRNVAILVADEPTPAQLRKGGVRPGSLLLGLYEGVPRISRYGQEPMLPDKITVFQKSIEAVARTPAAIREEVARTVWHELGHHFGLSEHAVRRAEQRRR